MNVIKQLPSELSDQIAAGEVIQNPASLIKELIENSIDAQATSIEIELTNSGFESITVKDDGVGIEKIYLHLAPKRHATSKISSFDDLYNISTMGFRGEALASIFSVAKVVLKSKPKNQEYAYQISTSSMNVEKTAHNNGTSITVEDLFYNTPARKKYLKNSQLELKEILKVIKLISIIHPHLKISLKNNSKEIFKKTHYSNLKDNCLEVLELNSEVELFDISITSPHFIISGFIINPNDLNYATRKHEYVYVNSRPVESKIIHKAVLNGIGTNIHLGRFPLYVLNIIIDPQLIDVNIHPAKLEIKFEQEAFIFEQISKGIQQLFQEQLLFKKAQISSKEKQTTFIEKSKNELSSNLTNKYNKNNTQKSYFLRDSQQELELVSSSIQEKITNNSYDERKNNINEAMKNDSNDTQNKVRTNSSIKTPLIISKETQNLEEVQGPLSEYFSNYRILGQLHKTFILVETQRGLIVIDQHVVEEKFYFELFKQYYSSNNLQKNQRTQYQELLKPIIIPISKEEELVFSEIQSILEQLGFGVELLKEREIIVRTLPFNLKGKCLDVSIIKDVLDSMNNSSSFELIKNSKEYLHSHIIEHLAVLSCKSSIRAGDELTMSQMHELIHKLKRLEEPFNCPHGRPIIVEYSFNDFEKMFKRK
ncbi:MAG: DNA mismatch repair endonuclease MutL [Nanoarchaeota archaeon]|nr:DNA mismatch repair endonuclease MutL [Nanoarchaeota archaeon]